MIKATIIIPNINGKGWLKDSIESIYAQTEQDFELDRGGQRFHRRKSGTSPQLLQPPELSPSSKTGATPAFPTQ